MMRPSINLNTMQRFSAELARQGHLRVVTRGGYEVKEWHERQEENTELIPIEATVVVDNRKKRLTYTANGRRYLNVVSDFDLLLFDPTECHDRDCMPDVLGAIHCVREGRYPDIKHCNKNYLRNDTTEGVAVDTSALKNY